MGLSLKRKVFNSIVMGVIFTIIMAEGLFRVGGTSFYGFPFPCPNGLLFYFYFISNVLFWACILGIGNYVLVGKSGRLGKTWSNV